MYRVKFDKLAVMPDGSFGNISQGNDVCYTDSPCGLLEDTINAHLNKQICVINEVVNIPGFVAPFAENQGDSKNGEQQTQHAIAALKSALSCHPVGFDLTDAIVVSFKKEMQQHAGA